MPVGKAKHLRPSVFLHRLPTLERMCEWITMDFVNRFPCTCHGSDSVLVIMDLLNMSTNFLPVQVYFSDERLSYIYIC